MYCCALILGSQLADGGPADECVNRSFIQFGPHACPHLVERLVKLNRVNPFTVLRPTSQVAERKSHVHA